MATGWDNLTVEERFWANVDKRGPDECWEWKGNLQEKGYGHFHAVKGKTVRAHRFAYEMVHGPTKLNVLHTCDNRKCVNERHLFAGTQAENMKDMWEKGRAASKIQEWQVSLIKRFLSNAVPRKQIAKDFGVTIATINSIAAGYNWSHVQPWRCSERTFTPEMFRIMGGVKSQPSQILS